MIVRVRHESESLPWFPLALLLVFVHLKLSGAIGWSWWWVFAPLWVMAVIGLTTAAVVGWRQGSRR